MKIYNAVFLEVGMRQSTYSTCEPATILTAASVAVAAGGAGASIAGQSQQNSAAKQVEQQKANAVDKQIVENRRRATEDFIASVQDEQLQEAQENEALVEQKIDSPAFTGGVLSEFKLCLSRVFLTLPSHVPSDDLFGNPNRGYKVPL